MDEQSLKLAALVLEAFQGRQGWIAAEMSPGVFNPFEWPLDAELFAEKHLSQERCLGFYLLREDDTVLISALDVDNHDNENPDYLADCEAITKQLDEVGLPYVVEISQSGVGRHIWLRFAEPVQASLVRKLWKSIYDASGISSRFEVYPRQDSLVEQKLGNLIRYPLWNKSEFVDQSPEIALRQLLDNPATLDSVRNVIGWDSCEQTSEGVWIDDELSPRVSEALTCNPSSILVRRWMKDTAGMSDKSRSSLALSICVELVRAFVPTPEIEAALKFWCEQNDYDKGRRDTWVRSTVDRAYDMAVGRKEKQSLTGNTFAALAHQYADRVASNEEVLIPTGIAAVDNSVGGIGFGELGIVSARPGEGKSALSMFWVDTAARCGYPTLLISLEMSARENSRRVLLRVGGVDPDRWQDEGVVESLHKRIADYYAQRAPLYFVEGAETIDRIEQVIDQYVQDYGVKLVCLDYQGLAVFDRYRSEYDSQTEITKRLKKCARRNDIAILSLVQLNRDMEQGALPELRNLKGSGEIEASADLIVFGVWPFKRDPSFERDGYIVKIAKCRNRRIVEPIVKVQFDDDRQVFV